MDPKDKEIADLKAANEKLTTEVKTRTTERDAALSDVEKLGKDLKAKDEIIEQKNADIIGARKSYKKLADMTQDEKDQLSAAELELKERQEKFEADQAKFQKEQKERQDLEVTSRRSQQIKKLVNGDEELAKKVEENFNKLDPALREKAITEEQLAPLITSAYDMLGSLKPNPVEQNIGAGDGGAPGEKEGGNNFADSNEGKGLLGTLGLPVEDPKAK